MIINLLTLSSYVNMVNSEQYYHVRGFLKSLSIESSKTVNLLVAALSVSTVSFWTIKTHGLDLQSNHVANY